MERLEVLHAQAPDSRAVDLSGQGIEELAPLVPLLARFPNLHALDVRGNPLRVSDLIPACLSLPTLRQLDVDASEEEEEQIVVALQDLMELNGTPLSMPDEEEREEQGQGQLQDQPPQPRQPQLPQQQQAATGGRLELSDLRSGARASASPTAAQATLPVTEPLPPRASSAATPTAPAANATASTAAVHSNPLAHAQASRGAEVTMSSADLDAVAQLFSSVLGVAAGLAPGSEQQLRQRYDQHIQSTLRGLEQQLQSISDGFLKQGEILRAKHQLYEVCFAETIGMLAPSMPAFGEVLRALRRAHLTLFEEVPAVLRAAVPAHEQQLASLRREVGRAEGETRQLLAAAELLEKEAETHAEEQLRLRAENDSMGKENARLKKGERDAQMRLRRARVEAATLHAKLGSSSASRRADAASAGASAGPPQAFERALKLEDSRVAESATGPPPVDPIYGSASQTGEHSRPAPAEPAQVSQAQSGGGSAAAAAQPTVRAISLRQLKDHIEAIYASKIKFDLKCSQAQLPRETMEQHMYTYLNQRYGLKSLIVDHASAIVKAVNKCAKQDNDVAVFGKILRNEIDEEFRFVQKQLKQTVNELLRVYLKGKYPLKADREIGRLLEQRQRGGVQEEEWVDIIKYMYNHQDALSLIVMVKDLCRQRARAQTREGSRERLGISRARGRAGAAESSGGANGKASLSLPHRLLMKVLLDFQLHGHDRFLAAFRELFRAVDTDRDGVLDEPQFRSLLASVDPSKTPRGVDELLGKVDPFSNHRITFSEAVTGLASELLQLAAASEDLKDESPRTALHRDYLQAREISDGDAGILGKLRGMSPLDAGTSAVTSSSRRARKADAREAGAIADEERREINEMTVLSADALATDGVPGAPDIGMLQREQLRSASRAQARLGGLVETARKEAALDPFMAEKIERDVAVRERQLARQVKRDLGSGAGEASHGPTFTVLWAVGGVAVIVLMAQSAVGRREELVWQYDEAPVMATSLELKAMRR
eukprot:g1185.t1